MQLLYSPHFCVTVSAWPCILRYFLKLTCSPRGLCYFLPPSFAFLPRSWHAPQLAAERLPGPTAAAAVAVVVAVVAVQAAVAVTAAVEVVAVEAVTAGQLLVGLEDLLSWPLEWQQLVSLLLLVVLQMKRVKFDFFTVSSPACKTNAWHHEWAWWQTPYVLNNNQERLTCQQCCRSCHDWLSGNTCRHHSWCQGSWGQSASCHSWQSNQACCTHNGSDYCTTGDCDSWNWKRKTKSTCHNKDYIYLVEPSWRGHGKMETF